MTGIGEDVRRTFITPLDNEYKQKSMKTYSDGTTPGSKVFWFENASRAWQFQLNNVLDNGQRVGPRNKPTKELRHSSLSIDMQNPIVAVPNRSLSYTFLAGEAIWIVEGDDTVEGIEPYNPNIAQFSDDGEKFFGAYGPRIVNQEDYVVDALLKDRDTRRAAMTIWRRNPPESKDIPCTVALTFNIRENPEGLELNCHAFMRSSDTWLGLPYDIFNFSMVAAKIACMYNEKADGKVELGYLYWTGVSSHIYLDPEIVPYTIEDMESCLGSGKTVETEAMPQELITSGIDGWHDLRVAMASCRDKLGNQDEIWRIRPE